MRRLFIFLFTLAAMSGVDAQVTFFAGPNHTGPSIKVYEGSISRMGSTIIGNDRLGSMIVPPGYRVTLYEHDYFRGYAETFTFSILNMPQRLYNEVSSVVVTNDNPRSEDPKAIIAQILPGFGAEPAAKVVVEADRARAIEQPPLVHQRLRNLRQRLTRNQRDARNQHPRAQPRSLEQHRR